jgi:penicillin-binding protein 2
MHMTKPNALVAAVVGALLVGGALAAWVWLRKDKAPEEAGKNFRDVALDSGLDFRMRFLNNEQGETLVAAIGQGYMLTSPLQLAVMAARIANGGKAVIPHVMRKIGAQAAPDNNWPSLGFNPRHLATVQDAMAAVVNERIGTAYAARIVKKGLTMAGKTGTSQVRRISEAERDEGVAKNESLPWKERDHALFTGFAPVGDPRYAIAVVVEHGGSGAHNAAPIARDILLECQTKAGRQL